MIRFGWLWLLCWLSSSAQASGSQSLLRDAEAAYQKWDFRQALALARAGLSVGDATAETTWRLHALLGQTAASMGEVKLAEESFAKALELHPSFEIPGDASPKVRKPFQNAQDKMGKQSLSAVPMSQRRGDQVHTQVRVEGDVLRLTDRVHLEVPRRPLEKLPLTRTDVWELHWTCATPRCEHVLTLADSQGNALKTLGTPAVPLQLDKELSPPARPWYRHPLVYLATAGVLAGAGAVSTVRASRHDAELSSMLQNRENHTYAEARNTQAARQTEIVLSVSFFALAGASAITGVAVW